MNSIREIKALHNGHWFDDATRRFFGSRISKRVYPSVEGTYFVTSERGDTSWPRRYSVRQAFWCGGEVHIRTVGGFGEFSTLTQAHRAARRMAEV